MSKKNKKNLQKLLEKKRALQEISTQRVEPTKPSILSTFRSTSSPSAVHPAVVTETEPVAAIPTHHSKEIIRTLISVLIIVLLMTGAIIVDKKTSKFTNFGNWLYRTL